MSIDTRTHQENGDTAPEGREPDARHNVPSQVAYDKQVPNNPDDDALPLDGSLTLSDTEPEDQTGQHPAANRVLIGSESESTADGAIETAAAATQAIAANAPQETQNLATPNPQVGQVATGGQ